MQLLLIRLRIISQVPGATRKELWNCVLLNSFCLAVACSTYYSLCGNGGAALEAAAGQDPFRAAICAKWLAPISRNEFPRFAAWVLYGELGQRALGRAGACLHWPGGITSRGECRQERQGEMMQCSNGESRMQRTKQVATTTPNLCFVLRSDKLNWLRWLSGLLQSQADAHLSYCTVQRHLSMFQWASHAHDKNKRSHNLTYRIG